LQWDSFHWDRNEVEIKPTAHFAAKSQDSYGLVQMEPAIMEVFREFYAQARERQFVIESTREAVSVRWNRYRCEPVFDALAKWLRTKGISGNKPLHTLRKEYGSAVCAAHGVYAASRALRHADITITTQFYTESRSRVTAGMSRLLPPAPGKIADFPPPADTHIAAS
jgi:hypothetical protein